MNFSPLGLDGIPPSTISLSVTPLRLSTPGHLLSSPYSEVGPPFENFAVAGS